MLRCFKIHKIGSPIKFVGKFEAFGPDPQFLFARVHPASIQRQNGTHQSGRKWTRRNNFLTPSLLPGTTRHHPLGPAASFLPRHRSRYWNSDPSTIDQFAKSIHIEMNLRNISSPPPSLSLPLHLITLLNLSLFASFLQVLFLNKLLLLGPI